MMATYRAVGRNIVGRDFVVGDLHGHLQQLLNQLDALAFDPARDRLFCLGDIIDRGPDSVALLDMIDQRVYFSILGNHEAMMIAGFEDSASAPLHFANGGDWFYELPEIEQQRLVDKVRQWPWAMEIETDIAQGTAGLVHADVPQSSWVVVTRLLDAINAQWIAGAPLSNPIVDIAAKSLLWPRKLVTHLYRNVLVEGERVGSQPEYRQALADSVTYAEATAADQLRPFSIDGIDRVYMGHTYVPEVTAVGDCHFLDTFRGERGESLSIVCLNVSPPE
ncbi:metallophosphoesterase [Microbulbifer bruguierae]|uniref:Metallophosphoesterase n=1 Tax=Microbulbifer bruguierae TaxID=3029061 RepID=A0ABY8NG35_9GAMM|nr:metallophosphoesterase [Microbulbifer bruguierae]WGL17895.1 metallophosphoesterase [Microbulbifer bruguierae]